MTDSHETEAQTGATHLYPVLIRESHLDTFGHVNNATYLRLFEEARWDLITERGYGMTKVLESRLGPVILEVSVKFRREVLNREALRIVTSLLDYPDKIGRLRQCAYKADGQVACEAVFTFALWDIDARKIVAPTADWARAVFLER